MSHVAYPQEFPLHCITEVVRIVRAGTIKDEAVDLASHLWNIQGYAQATLIGNPNDQPLFASLSPHDVERCDELTSCLETVVGFSGKQAVALAEATAPDESQLGDAAEVEKIDPTTILAIIEIAKMVLEMWKKIRPNK